jgi:hypothetical protein
MGLLVDIRKYNLDNIINDLIDSSKIKKKWWGKRIDSFPDYLRQNSVAINIDFNAHIISDLFAYFIDKLSFKEILNKYSKILSENRSAFVILLIINDKEFLLEILTRPSFVIDFELFCKDLNGEYYEYDINTITDNLQYFKSLLGEIDHNYGLIINIG